jgi:hypothetical protein
LGELPNEDAAASVAGPLWWPGALGGFVVAGFLTSWLPLVGVIVFFRIATD